MADARPVVRRAVCSLELFQRASARSGHGLQFSSLPASGVDETLRRTGDELRARLFSRLDEKPEADRAEVVLKRYLSGAHRDAQTMGCPLPAVVGEIGTTAGGHRAVLAEQVDALATSLGVYLPKDHGTPRRTLALGLVALMYGGLSLVRALKGTALSDEIIRACRTLGAAAARGMTKTREP